MAHPKRTAGATGVADALGLGSDRIVWDRCNSVWDTARRAWLTFDPEATHHLVIQDDAVPCLDLIAGTEKALTHVPDEAVVSLYTGTRRPMVREVNRAVARADEEDASWIVLNALCWGVAVILPTHIIPEMVANCDTQGTPGDDIRIRRFAQSVLKWPVWHTWPSLVDHQDDGSLIGHGTGRHAHRFLGAEISALDVDWAKPVVRDDRPHSRILRVTTGV